MATYYQEGSAELQADGLQTLYLMNPNNYVGFSDSQHRTSPTNVFFFNENSSAATSGASVVSHVPLPLAEQFVGIPISHEYPGHSPALDDEEEIHGSCQNTITFPSFGHYSLWGASVDPSAAGNQQNMYQQTSKVLSLSLSPHQERFVDNKSVHGYQDFSWQSSNGMMVSPKNSTSYSSTISAVPNGINTVPSVIIGSKYLKAAKQLLDEVVSIGNGMENGRPKGSKDKVKKSKESMALNVKASSTGGENGGKGVGVEFKIPQRQELQMKKAKLLCMLDEVEQRYRQYHHQMQIVAESFERVAGIGSAKSYTNLALNTILKQFKCLKDAVSAQIKKLNKTLGEEQGLEDGSRVLNSVDHQLRQEKTLQNLGMMQNNAWRPHRGLPERAVSVLRAWLFENFLHPYPKDSDKQMLAKQTELTRSQVSNWFINARVRLWKPMVEEMYLEEIKNQEQANSDKNCRIKNEPAEKELGSKQDENTDKTDRVSSFQSKPQNLQVPSPTEISASTVISTSPTTTQPGFAQLVTSLNMENIPENNPKKPRNRLDHTQNISPNSMLSYEMEKKETRTGFVNNKFSRDEQVHFSGTRFGYEIEELGLRFNNNTGQSTRGQIFHRDNNNNNNNVFLTLALPPSQNSPLSAARNHHHQNFHSNPNFEFGTRTESVVSHTSRVNGLQDSNIGYDQILDFQNRKTFPSRLLPDFAASQII